MAAEICSAQGVYIHLGNVFAECVHFLFSRIRNIVEKCFRSGLNVSLINA